MKKPGTLYLMSIGYILLFTIVAKVVFLVSRWTERGGSSPVVPLVTHRVVLMLAVGLESGVAALLFCDRVSTVVAAVCVLWLSLLFVSYRISLWASGSTDLCGCLGNVPAVVGVSGESTDVALKAVLLYMLLGSAYLTCRCRTGESPGTRGGTIA